MAASSLVAHVGARRISFRFDTVVISGAEKQLVALGLSRACTGIAMASALYGTVVGSLLGGWPADRFGRKATLLSIGILYFVGAVGLSFGLKVAMFIVARMAAERSVSALDALNRQRQAMQKELQGLRERRKELKAEFLLLAIRSRGTVKPWQLNSNSRRVEKSGFAYMQRRRFGIPTAPLAIRTLK